MTFIIYIMVVYSRAPENLKLQVEPFGNAAMETPQMTSADSVTTVCIETIIPNTKICLKM
jgi:lipoate synthase